ncbi:MAG: hypothetical protein ACTSQE_09130 [Candidatus Heimdallarchaeaceae archaeon]
MFEDWELRQEKQEFYSSYSFLLTIMHHYAIGNHNFEKKLNSWAINISYYSLMFVGRLIIWLPIKKIKTRHYDLILLLKGDKRFFSQRELQNRKKKSIQKERSELLSSINERSLFEEPEKVLKELGDLLDSLSEIRTYNNYEHFIISNQLGHKEIGNEFKELKPLILNHLKKWLEISIDVFLRYWATSRNFGYYLAVMENKIEELENLKIKAPPEYAYSWGVETFLFPLVSVSGVSKNIITEMIQIWKKKIEPYQDQIRPVKLSFYNGMTSKEFTGKNNVFDKFQKRVTLFKDVSK